MDGILLYLFYTLPFVCGARTLAMGTLCHVFACTKVDGEYSLTILHHLSMYDGSGCHSLHYWHPESPLTLVVRRKVVDVNVNNLVHNCLHFWQDVGVYLFEITQSSTQHIAWCARDHPVVFISLVLVEVRVMDAPIVDVSSVPTECGVTLDTPHLVAPVYLGDAGSARRARFGLFTNHLGRFHIVFVTSVLGVLVCSDDLEALWARVDRTQFALVLGGKEPATICPWTRHDEAFLLLLLSIVRAHLLCCSRMQRIPLVDFCCTQMFASLGLFCAFF